MTTAPRSAEVPAAGNEGAARTDASPPDAAPPARGAPSAPPASPLNPTPAEFPGAGSTFANADLDALMGRVTALRARVAALTAGLFASKLRVEVRSQSDTARLKTLRVSLDGGVVYSAPAQGVFDRPEAVYEHAVAAGPHVLALEVERQDLREPQFSTWQTSRFVVIVPEKGVLFTRLELSDESSLGEDFKEDQSGRYDLRVRLQVEVGE